MLWTKRYKLHKEKKENEEKLRRLHGREVRYASRRDDSTYTESVIGKNGIIDVTDDIFSIISNNRIIFRSPIRNIWGSDLMSLDGIILTPSDNNIAADTRDKIIVYYKYYRKVL